MIIQRIKTHLLHVLLGISCTGCVLYRTGNVTGSARPGQYDRYVSLVRGDARAFSFCGLGGLRKDALVQDARIKMMQSRQLAVGEYYNNYTFTFTRKYILVLGIDKATVCADVMRRCDSATVDLFSKEFRALAALPEMDAHLVIKSDTFYLGDKLYYCANPAKFKEVPYALSRFEKNQIYLRSLVSLRKIKRVNAGELDLFYVDKILCGYAPGDSLLVRDSYAYNNYVPATVLGTNRSKLLLKTKEHYLVCDSSATKRMR